MIYSYDEVINNLLRASKTDGLSAVETDLVLEIFFDISSFAPYENADEKLKNYITEFKEKVLTYETPLVSKTLESILNKVYYKGDI